MGKHRRRTDRALIGVCGSSSATLARDTLTPASAKPRASSPEAQQAKLHLTFLFGL